jgi:hypothetical protein
VIKNGNKVELPPKEKNATNSFNTNIIIRLCDCGPEDACENVSIVNIKKGLIRAFFYNIL